MLPKELWFNIANLITNPTTLFNFSLCSREFNSIFKALEPIKRKQFSKLKQYSYIEYHVLPNGYKEGVETLYHNALDETNRKIGFQQTYINNKREGISKHYHENGDLSAIINYKNDHRHGKCTFYYNSKVIGHPYNIKAKMRTKEVNYVDGKVQGLEKEWDNEGNLIRKAWNMELIDSE